MEIQYCSDLHLEFDENLKWLKKNPIIPSAEILIIAGDTIYIEEKKFKLSFFDWVSDHFKEVYMIPGNHEYYGGFDILNAYPCLEIDIRKNVKLVNNVSIKKENINFIFSTLWSQLRRNVEFVYMTMADFYLIKKAGKLISTSDYNDLFKVSLNFIIQQLNNSEGKNIIVTHHLPSPLLLNSSTKDTFLNDAYCSNLEFLIESNKINYWIYGHSHCNGENLKIGNTFFLTNQLGYIQKGEHYSFSNKKTLIL